MSEFRQLWLQLQERGILEKELIDHVWSDWKDIQPELLKLMEMFDLLFEKPLVVSGLLSGKLHLKSR